jgi:hypothetical protein
MTKNNMPRQSRSRTYFKVYSENYLWGSTRSELKPDERSVWFDLLSLASLNYGFVECFSRDQLAQQLVISRELLDRSIKKFIEYKKIKRKYSKREKKEIFFLVKWDHYQADYLKKGAKESTTYREKRRSDKIEESAAKNQPILKERRGEENRINENKLEENKEPDSVHPEDPNFSLSDLSTPFPSSTKPASEKGITIKEQFLSLLRKCKGYPFNELEDSTNFDVIYAECPGINIIKQTEKKIEWWGTHPAALKAYPRRQLYVWCLKEGEFQKRGGPQEVGEITKEIGDPDHRNFVKQFYLGGKHGKN